MAQPTEELWRRTIDFFLVLRTLGSAASRRRAEKLAETLEREVLDVFRVARQLETGLVHVLDLKERAVAHGRPSIVARLRDFTRRHVDLAGLDILDEQLGQSSASWYRQGELLLEAAERVRAYLYAYELPTSAAPRTSRGPSPGATSPPKPHGGAPPTRRSRDASRTRGRPACRPRVGLCNPRIAGYEGQELARRALAGDAQALDRVHELVGTILAERGEGGPARLVVRRAGADRETRGDTHAILAIWVVPFFSIPAHRANR